MKALRKLGTYLAAGLLWLLQLLPLPVIGALGRALGRVLYRFGRGRVTDINLALCFPDMPEAQRKALGKRHFEAVARSALEMGILWWGSDARILGLTTVKGAEHLEKWRGKPVIVLAPHFIGLNLSGARVAHEFPESASIYSRQKNPVLDKLLLQGRSRFGNPRLLSRQDGLRQIVRTLREGKLFYFLPDMDFGARDAIFSPFFGVPAATITALPRLAKLTGAAVVPVVSRQNARGYEIEFYPAWENYPTADLEADIRRMNAFIEERVLEVPEQYFWAHKRFKTRPPGEPSPYRKRK
jgi:KDO2-lipid IV(A) lauroyltransferase